MFERYTEAARRALFFSRYEVSQRGGSSIEGYHLLLGLIRDSDAPIADILGHFQVTTPMIYREIDARTSRSEAVSASAEIPFSKGMKDVFNRAREEADRLRHKHIGPEHLLLGLLAEERSVVAAVLKHQGIGLQAVRDYIETHPEAASPSRTAPAGHDLFETIKLLVDQLSHADRNSGEAAELVARIHRALNALKVERQ